MSKERQALIVTNIRREQPETILDILTQRGWKSTIVNLDQGEFFPSPHKFGALIVMGGPPSAKDKVKQTAWMPDEISKIKEALKAGVPYLGTCLGLQTLVFAAGGEIIKSPRKEVGFRESYEPKGNFYTVHLTTEGKKDPVVSALLGNFPDSEFPVFHLHGEAVEIPDTMKPPATLLATADVVPNQIVRIGNNAYGIQGHFEVTKTLLQEWLDVDPDLELLGEQGKQQVLLDFLEKQKEYTEGAVRLYHRFFELAEKL